MNVKEKRALSKEMAAGMTAEEPNFVRVVIYDKDGNPNVDMFTDCVLMVARGIEGGGVPKEGEVRGTRVYNYSSANINELAEVYANVMREILEPENPSMIEKIVKSSLMKYFGLVYEKKNEKNAEEEKGE